MRIDAHVHLWRYNAAEFGWIDERSAVLRRDFLTADLEPVMKLAGVDAAIAVQARPSLEETRFLLDAARSSARVCGVVGWVPLGAADLPATLDEFRDETKLSGFREMTQGEAAGYLDRPEVDRGIAALTERGYVYDLLLRADQLQEATRLVDRHPRQRFVLNHAAKPRIAAGVLEPWATDLRALAERPDVCCKLSGLVTEADWTLWTAETLRPYLDVCVEAFGVRRLLAGSDWPVALPATEYAAWWSVLDAYFASFSQGERAAVFGGNAQGVYGCVPSVADGKVNA